MRVFQAILGLWALLLIGSQTIRHAYVLWVEPRTSVLDEFDETRQEILAAKSIDELVALYRPAIEKVREEEAQTPREDRLPSYERAQVEPYKTEAQIRHAIEEWETHHRRLVALHFFWWVGFGTMMIAAAAYLRWSRWLGISLFVLGFLEMFYTTCPSLASFGFPLEFERLLILKLVYSVLTLALVLIGWWVALRQWRRPRPSAA